MKELQMSFRFQTILERKRQSFIVRDANGIVLMTHTLPRLPQDDV